MSYLFPFIQLYLNSVTRIVIEDREILIEKIDDQLWKVSIQIFEDSLLCEELYNCLQILRKLKKSLFLENKGYLELDSLIGVLYWVKVIPPLEFGREFPSFFKQAQQWANLLSQQAI